MERQEKRCQSGGRRVMGSLSGIAFPDSNAPKPGGVVCVGNGPINQVRHPSGSAPYFLMGL